MRFTELVEGSSQYVYHVTFTDHVPSIMKGGLKPLQTSNWIKAGTGKRYNEEGGVFAFAHPEDAFRWAFSQEFDFKKPVSIVKMKRGDSWEKDPSQDIALQMGKGDALRSIAAVPASDIVGVYDYADFGTPMSRGISQQEWIADIIKTLS